MFGATSLTDAQVTAAVNGSQADQSLVMESLAPQVKSMVAIRLAPTPGQAHLVEDLSQQAMMAIIESLATLRTPSVVALKAFASTIVARRVCDFLRERQPDRRVFSLDSTAFFLSTGAHGRDLLPGTDTTPRSAAGRAELSRLAIMELGTMKQSYRQIITLAFFDQLPVDEICEKMNLSRAATTMLLFRAITALREKILPTRENRTMP
jgi:RNA polymerase sigma factor (sigma-70 family)